MPPVPHLDRTTCDVDLKRRLAQFDHLRSQRPAAAGEQATVPLPGATLADLLSGLGLHRRDRQEGPLWLRDHPVGDVPAPCVPWPSFAALLPRADAASLQAEELLFLDTETTGLVGGTGSLAFLIGLGWWAEGGFQVRQLFLAGPQFEAPILAELNALALARKVVVTYNGNAFDLPLLRTRALLSRRQDPLASLVSWDLLPAARRLWGRRLPDCRQQTIERVICGSDRGPGDIEGWQISQTYFRFLREGDPSLLPRVVEHNRRDLLGMARIFQALHLRALALGRGPALAGSAVGDPWQDAWANARICAARREPLAAARWLQLALPGRFPPCRGELAEPRPESFYADAVVMARRAGDWSQLETVIALGLQALGHRPWLHKQAAILYEHRLRRLDLAYHHARRLDDPVRLGRLERKLARQL